AVGKTAEALRLAVGGCAVVRVPHSVHAGARSVPEPDVDVVTGTHDDYVHARPKTALLVVEVARTSLARDRRRKARIYAAAGIPEYWIVNLRDDVVEVSRSPNRDAARYTETRIARRGERLELVALPGRCGHRGGDGGRVREPGARLRGGGRRAGRGEPRRPVGGGDAGAVGRARRAARAALEARRERDRARRGEAARADRRPLPR